MTIVSKFVLQELDGIGAYFGALETMPPSFLAALVVGYLVAVIWPDPTLQGDYQKDLSSQSVER